MKTSIRPLQISLTILVTTFVSEFVVMLVLPFAVRDSNTSWLEASIDASLLTLVLIPFLWLSVIRPLRAIASMRTRLLEQFVTLQEEERKRLAFDLHDEIGQSLTAVKMGLKGLDSEMPNETRQQRVEDLRAIVNGTVQEVRRIANGLRPAALDHLGLEAAIERLAEEVSETHQLTVTHQIQLGQTARLPPAIETTVYRIVQEALTNAVRHSEAKHVTLSLTRQNDVVWLTIADDGKGFSTKKPVAKTTDGQHLGLTSMAERTALVNGEFAINTDTDRGTRIRVKIPLTTR